MDIIFILSLTGFMFYFFDKEMKRKG
jgi:hypothetical protein